MNPSFSQNKITHWRIALLRDIINFLFAVLTHRAVYGQENIPGAGACLLVFNHLSNFDPPLIYTLLRRTDALGLVAALHDVFLCAAILAGIGAITVIFMKELPLRKSYAQAPGAAAGPSETAAQVGKDAYPSLPPLRHSGQVLI